MYSWHKRFADEGGVLEDREGREEINRCRWRCRGQLREAHQENRRLTLRTLSDMFAANIKNVHSTLTQALNMRVVIFTLQALRRDLTYALSRKRLGVPFGHFALHLGNASSHTTDDDDGCVRTRIGFPSIMLTRSGHFWFCHLPTIKLHFKGSRLHSL